MRVSDVRAACDPASISRAGHRMLSRMPCRAAAAPCVRPMPSRMTPRMASLWTLAADVHFEGNTCPVSPAPDRTDVHACPLPHRAHSLALSNARASPARRSQRQLRHGCCLRAGRARRPSHQRGITPPPPSNPIAPVRAALTWGRGPRVRALRPPEPDPSRRHSTLSSA